MSNCRFIQGFGRVCVEITGVDDFNRAIEDVIRKNKNPNAILKLIGARMKKIIQGNFRAKKNLDGSPWEPLSATTIEMRRKGRRSGRAPIPLRDTNRLYNSIGYIISSTGVTAGTNVTYGPLQQLGSDNIPGYEGARIPAREFIFLSDEHVSDIMEMLTNELIVEAFS